MAYYERMDEHPPDVINMACAGISGDMEHMD